MVLSFPSFLASARSSLMVVDRPLSGGVFSPRLRAPSATAGVERTVKPAAAATLRFSICDRLMSVSASLRQNSCSCSSYSSMRTLQVRKCERVVIEARPAPGFNGHPQPCHRLYTGAIGSTDDSVRGRRCLAALRPACTYDE